MSKQSDTLNKLFTECGLDIKEDIFKKVINKNGKQETFTMIRRTGIEKIISKKLINITYEHVHVARDLVVIKAKGIMVQQALTTPIVIETYGSAAPETMPSNFHYLVETAEKRAMSRVVLKLTKLYEQGGVMGEDEIDPSGDSTEESGIGSLSLLLDQPKKKKFEDLPDTPPSDKNITEGVKKMIPINQETAAEPKAEEKPKTEDNPLKQTEKHKK